MLLRWCALIPLRQVDPMRTRCRQLAVKNTAGCLIRPQRFWPKKFAFSLQFRQGYFHKGGADLRVRQS